MDPVQLVVLAGGLVQRFEHARDLELEMAAVEHVLEGRQRARMLRLIDEDLAVDIDRALAIAESGLEHVAQPELELGDLAVVVREIDLAPHDLAQLGPGTGCRVQPIEREDGGLGVRGVEGHVENPA